MRVATLVATVLLLLLGCGAQPVNVRTVDATQPSITTSTSTSIVDRETSTTTSTTSTTVAPLRVRRPAADPTPSSTAVGLPPLLRRIGGCESSGDPAGPLLWTRENPHSTASGAFQDLDGTWLAWAREFYPPALAWARAMYAPPDVQVEVNVRAYEANGTAPWVSSSGCWS